MLLALFSQTMEKIVWEKIHDKNKKRKKNVVFGVNVDYS
jgi:hypothetical protein